MLDDKEEKQLLYGVQAGSGEPDRGSRLRHSSSWKEFRGAAGADQALATSAEPRAKDQVSLTDEDSRIMPSNEGFKQCCNAQAGADVASHLIVEQHLSQKPNDKQEVTLERLQKLPEELGTIDVLLADTGYFSEANVEKLRG